MGDLELVLHTTNYMTINIFFTKQSGLSLDQGFLVLLILPGLVKSVKIIIMSNTVSKYLFIIKNMQ